MSAKIPPKLKFIAKSITKPNGTKGVRKYPVRELKEPAVQAQIPWNHPEHGEKIWVFKHIQKNHVVYSLSKVLNNNASIRQLPFNGKKTVPPALRKDLWFPFAQVSFPPGQNEIGLSCYQKLREYRRRHELEWGNEIRLDAKGQPETRRARGRKICDQKANTVADMAAIFNRLAVPGEEAEEVKEDEVVGEVVVEPTLKQKRKAEAIAKAVAKVKADKNIGLKGEGTGTVVRILWNDLSDAEFAEEWEENVEHGALRKDVSGLKALHGDIVEHVVQDLEELEQLVEGDASSVIVPEEIKPEGERQKL